MKKFLSLARSIAWPIHREELRKVISMLLLLSFLCIPYSILRNIKDTIILTAKASGAEVIPFIKVWGILPGVIFGTWLFARLRSRFGREKVFYIIVTSLVAYFLLFAFFIFPHSDSLNLTNLNAFLTKTLPSGFKGLIAMICNWTFSTFYIISELWSVLILTVLFWGFANDITPLSQAKRCYGMFNIGSNFAPILGGMIAIFFGTHLISGSASSEIWHQTLIKLTLLISFFSLLAMAVFYWINRKVVPFEPNATDPNDSIIKNSKKKRLSIRDCIKYIASSKYLICLAMIVLGFNIAINFTDVLWKEQLKNHFSDPNALLVHMNRVSIGIGCFATIAGLLFSFIVRKFGWTFVAILTPIAMIATGFVFFAFFFCGNMLESIAQFLFGLTPLAMTVYAGSVQNCLSKAGKYSVFDASKELAFLAVDPESRLKGKAAIDGLGSGIGKSGSSIIYQVMLLSMGTIPLCAPYIATILFIVFIGWIYSIRRVAKEFNEKSKLLPEETSSYASTTT
ncbi:MAG: NTP/NDP exchange transporter [Chlamydiae bacterium]|nr:NTP/NDP exchange transporter [Chlamydiota bacterium]